MHGCSRVVRIFVVMGWLVLPALLRAQVPTVSSVAGGVPEAGPGTSASLEMLGGIGRDASGNVYFASAAAVILELDTTGTLSVFAGNGTCCFSGDGGPATNAQASITPFAPVSSVKVDPAGNVYFVDTGTCVIRMIPAGGGNITTVAGTPNTDYTTFPNCNYGGDGGPATSATMSPAYIAFDPTGNMYIADQSVCVIRKVDHVTQTITTVAGNVAAGCAGNIGVGDGGPATSAQFVYPFAVAVDAAGDIYVGDFFPITGPGDVRRVDGTTHQISTIGGGGATLPANGLVATNAVFGGPTGLALDSGGNLLIADSGLNLVMSENPATKILTLLAGDFALGPGFSGDGGPATSAQLHSSGSGGAMDVVVDGAGNLTLTDTLNFRVRRVDFATKTISTIAGNGSAGDGGPATSAIVFAGGTAVDAAGNAYIADLDNGRIRKVDPSTGQISTVAGSDVGPAPAPSGDGQPATSAQLLAPRFPAVDASGNIFFVTENNAKIRRVDGGSGIINTYAGTGTAGYNGDGTPAASAQLNTARGLAVNAAGDLFIADAGNQEVRVVDHSSLNINAAAGSHALGPGYTGDGGAATQARLHTPSYVAVDSLGNLFITDRGNNVIRRVDAVTQKITTVAGNFAMGAGFSGDGGPATMARLNSPRAAATDMYGNLYIADGAYATNRMRVVNSVTGIITTLGGTGAQNFSGDGGPAAAAGLAPTSVSISSDASGNILVYFSDGLSARVRLITVPPVPAFYVTPAAGLSFGNQVVGTPSAAQTLTVANSGTGSLTVSAVNFVGPNAADFAVVSGGTCTGTTNFTLAPTASCTLKFTFTPSLAQGESAILFLTAAGPFNSQPIPLTGTGTPAVGPGISATPDPLAFGAVPQGTPSAPRTLVFSNPGSATLTITGLGISGGLAADFAQAAGGTCGNLPISVNASGNCTVLFTFTPSTNLVESTTLQVTDNAPLSPQSVVLTGTGTSPEVQVPPFLEFGQWPMGATSGNLVLTLVNQGNGTLNFMTPAYHIVGTNAGDFQDKATTCSGSVAPAGSCTITLTFTPSTMSTETATVTFSDNAPPGTQSVPLYGAGVGLTPMFTMTTLPAGAVGVPYGVDIGVSGGSPPYSYAVTSGSLPAGFMLNPTQSGNLNAGHIYTVDVNGNPGAPAANAGTFTFGVTVTDSTNNMTTATISLTIGPAPANTNPGLLKGQYAFQLSAFGDSDPNIHLAIGSLTFDGAGAVTGVVDLNEPSRINQNLAVTGTYSVGPDNRGYMVLNAAGMSGSLNLAVAIGGVYRGLAYTASLTQFNDNAANDHIGSGFMRLQDPAAFTQNSFAGTFAYGLTGQDSTVNRAAVVGAITFDNALHVTGGMEDLVSSEGAATVSSITGTYTAPDANGRTVLSLNLVPGGASTTVVYIISAGESYAMSLDNRSVNDVLIGSALKQLTPGAFTNASLAGPDVFRLMGQGGGGTEAIIGLGGTSAGTLTVTADQNSAGALLMNEIYSATYSVAANGRTTVTPPPASGNQNAVLYLASQDRGFFLSADPAVTFGYVEPQVGSSFSAASLTGNAIFGQQETVSGHEATSGVAMLTAPGSGIFNLTVDDSHSAGNLSFAENFGTITFSIMGNGHFSATGPSLGNATGYLVSPYEWALFDTSGPASDPTPSVHPQLTLIQTFAAPPGTPSPIAETVIFPMPVTQGNTATSTPVTFTNTGLGPMVFTGVDPASNSPDFSASGTCLPAVGMLILQPGSSCTLMITFMPTVTTPTGTLLTETLILDTDGTSNVTYTLQGTAMSTTSCGTNSWTGTAGDGQWTTATNWSTGVIPVSTDDACIPTGFNVTVGALAAANQTIRSLTVQGTSTLTVSSGPLTVSTTATLTSLTVNGGSLTVTGAATVSTSATVSAGTVNFNGATTIAALNLSGGALMGSGTVTVSGPVVWSGGTIGGAENVTANGTITVSGGATLDTATLNAASTMTISTGCLAMANGAMLKIGATGLLDIRNGCNIASTGGAAPAITNSGTVQQSTSAGPAFINVTLVNSGTVQATTGTLVLNGGSTSTGNYKTTASGAILQFGGAAPFNLSGALSGIGTFNFQGGTQNLTGTYTVTTASGTTSVSGATVNMVAPLAITSLGALNLSAGTLNLSSATATVTTPSLTFSATGSATLSGTNNLTVNGATTWTGGGTGSLAGTGTTTLNGPITISNGIAAISAGMVIAKGNTTVSGAGGMSFSNGATWTNFTGFTFAIQNNATFSQGPGAQGIFVNQGTLLSTSPTQSFFGPSLNNTGLVNVMTGTLSLTGGGTCAPAANCSGSITLANNTALTFGNGTYNLGGSLTGTGTTAVTVNNGATVNFAAPAAGITTMTDNGVATVGSGINLGIGTLTVSGGSTSTLSGFGSITGNVNVSNGNIHAGGSPGTLTINGNFTMGGGGVLNADLGGTTAGTGYSQIVVNGTPPTSGTATLAGTLNVTNFGGFSAAAGNSFILILPAAVTGTFATTILPPPPSGSTFSVSYAAAPTGVVLMASAAPAPVVGPLTPVMFGSVPQLTTSGSMMVTLTNTGTAALNFSAAPSLSGANASDFAIVGNPPAVPACALGAPVAANGGTCTVTLTFTPSSNTVTENASLVFMDDATPPTQIVALSGTGIPPNVSITGSGAFGNQVVNTPSAAQTLTVSVAANTGTLVLTSITITGANAGDFAISGTGTTCPLGAGTLAGNMSCAVAITFTPTAAGARNATLNVAGSDLPGTPKTAALSGTGTAPAVTLMPTGLTFGVVALGSNSTMSVRVTNSGTATLTFNNLTITGPNMADFTFAEGTTCSGDGGQVSAGNFCTIAVTFTPSAIQPESATLNIFDNAAGSPQTVALAGGGPGFTLMVPPSSTGGNGSTITVLPGDTATYTLMLTCSPGVTGTITLAGMQPLPPSTILTITPMMITCPSTGPVTVMVSLQTNCTATLVAPRGPFHGPAGPSVPLSGVLAALLLMLLGTWLVASGFVAPASRRLLAVTASEGGRPVGFAKLAPALVLLVAVVLPLCLAGCGVN
ncbi:MAG TPA: choice-of-anchor D domain-containing protein, partial [Candidatus Binatia bacterium]|nr:choice-of-anchor D domain-containing protein [Candidatus Binatia bacterium]